MDIPNEIWCCILFEYTKYNMSTKYLLELVSRDFNTIIKTDVNQKWEEFMNISIEILVTMAYFVDRPDNDCIDYLMGPILISNFKSDNISSILPQLSYCNDRYNSKRLLDSVILSNLKMGQHFGPDIIGIDTPYNTMVKYYRNDNNEIVSNSSTNIELSNYRHGYSKPNISTNIYWLYIFEELCHYCITYSYMILPYYDENITQNNGSLLYTIYQLNIDKMIYIEDRYSYDSSFSNDIERP